jgi:hypothetical protein
VHGRPKFGLEATRSQKTIPTMIWSATIYSLYYKLSKFTNIYKINASRYIYLDEFETINFRREMYLLIPLPAAVHGWNGPCLNHKVPPCCMQSTFVWGLELRAGCSFWRLPAHQHVDCWEPVGTTSLSSFVQQEWCVCLFSAKACRSHLYLSF